MHTTGRLLMRGVTSLVPRQSVCSVAQSHKQTKKSALPYFKVTCAELPESAADYY